MSEAEAEKESERPETNEVQPVPDPTVLTVQLLRHELRGVERELALRQAVREREQAALQDVLERRLDGITNLSLERLEGIRRENALREAHRLELKADSEKTLATATIAAEKAVQAALAAAEKARDQQTIASQLATNKSEEAAKEQTKQQGETFGTAINALNAGLGDVKGALAEMRAEQRGGRNQVVEHRALTTQTISIIAILASVFGGVIVAALLEVFTR